jgi:hypothetical protein
MRRTFPLLILSMLISPALAESIQVATSHGVVLMTEEEYAEPAYASASGDAICCGGGRVRGVEQRTNIDRFG